MPDANDYIIDCIKTWVWSGFRTPTEVENAVGDIIEPGADEARLRAAVGHEFARKKAAEASWPDTTDCDRLDRAFADLAAEGVIALHYAGNTMSDGLDDVTDALEVSDRAAVKGYCFYHGQDVERAVRGGGLWIAFGSFDRDPSSKAQIGSVVTSALEKVGLDVDWNGDPEARILLSKFDWKRRLAR